MAEAVLRVTRSVRIARPIEIVRRQFGDVHHHETRRVHRDVRFTVLADSAGECRYAHEVRVAGLRQSAEVIMKREADGSQTNHFVSGSNVGMKVIHRFRPAGAETTVAEVTVELPLRGLRRLLAPLVRRAVRRSLATGLEEDRRDLEEHGYPALAARS
jgi:hypothetical protein